MSLIQRVPWTTQPQYVCRPDEKWKSRGLRTLASAAARVNAVNGALPTSTSGTGGFTVRGRSVEYARANNGDRYAAPHLNVGSAGDGSVLLLWQHSSTALAGTDRAIANVGTDVTTAGFRIATNGTGSDTVYGQAYNTSATLVSITGPTLVDGRIYCTVLTAGTTLTLYHDNALIGTAAVSGGVRRTASAKTVGPGYLADVNALIFAEFESLLTDQEAFALMRNPWQLFAPLPRTIWAPVSASGGTTIAGALGTAVASGFNGIVNANRTVAGALGTAIASGFTGTISNSNNTSIAGALGTAIASGFTGTVSAATAIAGNLGTAVASGFTGTISNGGTSYVSVYMWRRTA